jgi:hypothetical protein
MRSIGWHWRYVFFLIFNFIAATVCLKTKNWNGLITVKSKSSVQSMNETSSRAHTIVRLHLSQRRKNGGRNEIKSEVKLTLNNTIN